MLKTHLEIRKNSRYKKMLTVDSGVHRHRPVLEAGKEVIGVVLQAEDGVGSRGPAGQQTLGPCVQAAIGQDAAVGTNRHSL